MTETLLEGVVRNVADANGVETGELPPLYDAIDPDALDGVVTTMSAGEISFTYAGQNVTVTSTGAVDLASHSAEHPAAETVVSDD